MNSQWKMESYFLFEQFTIYYTVEFIQKCVEF